MADSECVCVAINVIAVVGKVRGPMPKTKELTKTSLTEMSLDVMS